MSKSQVKILLVEDEKLIGKAYVDGLTRAGFMMILAEDGADGIVKAVHEKPDLILLDIIMPKVDGFTMLKKLQEDSDLKNIPVVIVSNLGNDTDITYGKSLGAADYLVKANYTMQELVQKIKANLPVHKKI